MEGSKKHQQDLISSSSSDEEAKNFKYPDEANNEEELFSNSDDEKQIIIMDSLDSGRVMHQEIRAEDMTFDEARDNQDDEIAQEMRFGRQGIKIDSERS